MKSFANITIIFSMLLHALFGCCWHHAHAHAAAGNDDHEHATVDVAKAKHEHAHHGHEHHGHAHVDVDHHSEVEASAVESSSITAVECGFHRHEGCPHSHGDAFCSSECAFVKGDERTAASPLKAISWSAIPVCFLSSLSSDNAESWTRVGPDVPSAALPLRAHVALQVFLL